LKKNTKEYKEYNSHIGALLRSFVEKIYSRENRNNNVNTVLPNNEEVKKCLI